MVVRVISGQVTIIVLVLLPVERAQEGLAGRSFCLKWHVCRTLRKDRDMNLDVP